MLRAAHAALQLALFAAAARCSYGWIAVLLRPRAAICTSSDSLAACKWTFQACYGGFGRAAWPRRGFSWTTSRLTPVLLRGETNAETIEVLRKHGKNSLVCQYARPRQPPLLGESAGLHGHPHSNKSVAVEKKNVKKNKYGRRDVTRRCARALICASRAARRHAARRCVQHDQAPPRAAFLRRAVLGSFVYDSCKAQHQRHELQRGREAYSCIRRRPRSALRRGGPLRRS